MLECCAVCGAPDPNRFHLSEGSVYCSGCAGNGDLGIRMPVSPGVLAAMRYITSCDRRKLFSFRLSEEGQAKLSEIAESYLLTQLERGFFTLEFYKSLRMT